MTARGHTRNYTILTDAIGLAGLPGRFTIISETHNSQEMGAIRLKNLINSGTCGHKEVGYLVE